MFDKKYKVFLKFGPEVSTFGSCAKVGLKFVLAVNIPYHGFSSIFLNTMPPLLYKC